MAILRFGKSKKAITAITAIALSISCSATAQSAVPVGFQKIAHQCNVPPEALYGIALTETETGMANGSSSVWHYSLNWKGKSYHFASREELYQFAQKLIKKGYQSFDVGIMQLNWYWQKHRGYTLWELTDIRTNIEVACEVLKEGYKARGNWVEAAGYYHNPSVKKHYDRYMRIYKKKISRLADHNQLLAEASNK
ncbi:transglycosylase SLT domain-containing protein [Vibrio gangliei]|uniref:transglycosylase SLT domain-containing protein n=1 Tax=Vibrio gangliei TaxID=2077090 RepID=UPI001300B2A6|nr:transglycosylase SLT domain-containing protein [Vibrio gangliei]